MLDDSWQPLLVEPGVRAGAIATCRELVAGLAAAALRCGEPRQLLELTLLFTWASDREELALDIDLAALATACLTRRIDVGVHEAQSAGLFGGIAGLAWTLARLVEADEAHDPCAPILDRLTASLDEPDRARDYDLVGGLVGFGVAGLERTEAAAGQRLLRRVLDGLEQASPSWLTPPEALPDWKREQTPAGRHDLGMAHGVAGAIALLARMVAAPIDDPRARALLDGAVAYLLSTAPPDPASRFASWLPDGPRATRLAWCYGDLGTACALLAAADAADHAGWRHEAIELARSAARRPLRDSGVIDRGLCHGAAGVAHLFNRLAQATGDPILRDAAFTWFDRLLSMPPGDADDPTLVTGSAGVALALLAALSPVEPGWDRLFLVG